MDVQQVSPCHDFSLAYWKLARLQTLVLFSRLNWNKNKRKAICNNNLYKNIKFKPEWDIIFVAGRVYMDTRYVYYRQLEYLHVSISSGSKCFSHVNTLPLSIWFWKSLSMTHLRQLIWPLFLPLLVFCISWWVQFKDTNLFSSTASTATKHRTVVTRHSIFNTTNSENDSSQKNYIVKL